MFVALQLPVLFEHAVESSSVAARESSVFLVLSFCGSPNVLFKGLHSSGSILTEYEAMCGNRCRLTY